MTTRIIAFDVESGGLSADRHALTQLAVVACQCTSGKPSLPIADKSEVKKFVRVWAVKPAHSLILEDDALAIQGHTRRSLFARPNQWEEEDMVASLLELLAGLGEEWEDAPLVAHNARFDHGFLDALCRRTKTPLIPRHALCTVERQREIVKRKLAAKSENNKLGTLAQLVGLSQSSAHDALEDTKICAALFAWQENLLGQGSLMTDELAEGPVGLVYKYEPPAESGWWQKHGEELPVKAPDPAVRTCGGCGQPALWRRPYRLTSRRGGAPPVSQFFACAGCKGKDVVISEAIGLSGDEMLAWAGEWFKLIATPAPSAQKPEVKPDPDQPFLATSPEVAEVLRRAHEGQLPSVPGFSHGVGEVEDANRFAVGSLRVIQHHLRGLEKLAGAVKGIERNV